MASIRVNPLPEHNQQCRTGAAAQARRPAPRDGSGVRRSCDGRAVAAGTARVERMMRPPTRGSQPAPTLRIMAATGASGVPDDRLATGCWYPAVEVAAGEGAIEETAASSGALSGTIRHAARPPANHRSTRSSASEVPFGGTPRAGGRAGPPTNAWCRSLAPRHRSTPATRREARTHRGYRARSRATRCGDAPRCPVARRTRRRRAITSDAARSGDTPWCTVVHRTIPRRRTSNAVRLPRRPAPGFVGTPVTGF